MEMIVRDARLEETEALSELVLRSKASHGYDAAFVEACRSELRITAERLHAERVRVAARASELLGVASLHVDADEAELTALFVEPAHLGTGIGRALWCEVLEECAARGARRLRIESDPFAVDWYTRHGAVRVGDVPSGSIPGRRIPLLELSLRWNG